MSRVLICLATSVLLASLSSASPVTIKDKDGNSYWFDVPDTDCSGWSLAQGSSCTDKATSPPAVSIVSVASPGVPTFSTGQNDDAFDGDYGTATLFPDDSPATSEITGHVILDFGTTTPSEFVVLTSSQNHDAANPSSVDVFYFLDDDPTNNAVVDDVEGDSDIVSLAQHDLIPHPVGHSDFVSWPRHESRYLGIRFNGSFSNELVIAEVVVLRNEVIPEPTTGMLALVGVLFAFQRRCH